MRGPDLFVRFIVRPLVWTRWLPHRFHEPMSLLVFSERDFWTIANGIDFPPLTWREILSPRKHRDTTYRVLNEPAGHQ